MHLRLCAIASSLVTLLVGGAPLLRPAPPPPDASPTAVVTPYAVIISSEVGPEWVTSDVRLSEDRITDAVVNSVSEVFARASTASREVLVIRRGGKDLCPPEYICDFVHIVAEGSEVAQKKKVFVILDLKLAERSDFGVNPQHDRDHRRQSVRFCIIGDNAPASGHRCVSARARDVADRLERHYQEVHGAGI